MRLAYYPSLYSPAGYRAEKWPDDFDPRRVSKISATEDEKLLPAHVVEIAGDDASLTLDQLIAKYPPPPSVNRNKETGKPISRVPQKQRASALKVNSTDEMQMKRDT